MDEWIRSRQNPHIKALVKYLHKKRARDQAQCFVLENEKHARDVLAQHPDRVVAVYRHPERDELELDGPWATHIVEPALLASVSELGADTGMLVVCQQPTWSFDEVLASGLTVAVLDHIQDPGNVGTICRNAAAFGVDMVMMTEGCADIYHPLALRAMAGVVYALPVLSFSDARLAACLSRSFSPVLLSVEGDLPSNDERFPAKTLFIFGSEGQGIVSSELLALPDPTMYRIPMVDGVESLNVASSAAIVFHHRFCTI